MQNRSARGQSQPAQDGMTLRKQKKAIEQLAGSGEAKQLVSMLKRTGGVQQAAQAAAKGEPEQLMAMVQQLMNTKEGAELVERLRRQAEKSGLS